MKYRIIAKKNPQDKDAAPKFYASPVNMGKVNLDDFADRIAGRSSLTRGDIKNVLSNFLDELPLYLKMGASVNLAEFGTCRLTLSSIGTETADEFSADHIKGVKVVFTPSTQLKRSLLDIKFDKEE